MAYLNRAVYQLPRNGTTSHTVDPTSATNLVAGATFTPTAGRLLVAVIEGAVTSTTPTGWTLPTGGSAVNGTGLYVWHRTAAAGSNSFTTTHNGSDYPVVVAVYEFAAGSTFAGSVSAVSVASSGANPNLTGLTGTNQVMGVKATSIFAGSGTYSMAWTGTGTPVEDWDVFALGGATDGYVASLAYVDAFAGTSWQPTGTISGTAATSEALTFAVKVATATIPEVATPLTGSGTVVAAPVPVAVVAAPATGAGSAAVTITASVDLDAPTSGAGDVTAAASTVVEIAVPLTGTGSSTATIAPVVDAVTPLAGGGAVSVGIETIIDVLADASGAGTVAGSSGPVVSVSAPASGEGSLLVGVESDGVIVVDVALAGTGTVAADVSVVTAIPVPVTGVGQIASGVLVSLAVAVSTSGDGSAGAIALPVGPVASRMVFTTTLHRPGAVKVRPRPLSPPVWPPT